MGDVVEARRPGGGDPAQVGGAGERVEGAAEMRQRETVAQVGGPAARGPVVIDGLHPGQEAIELDRPRRPVGGVLGDQLQQRQRSLAPPVADRVRNRPAGGQHRGKQPGPPAILGHLRRGLIADKGADVRDDPVVAGLDEPVRVLPLQIVLDYADLLGDDPQQRPQRLSAIDIALTVDDGQKVVEPVRVAGHDVTSVRISVSASAGFR